MGLRSLTHAASQPLATPARLALCGGIALYLLGHLGFRWRIAGQLARRNAVAAVACLVLFGLTKSVAGWGVEAGAAAVLGALCVADRVAEHHARA